MARAGGRRGPARVARLLAYEGHVAPVDVVLGPAAGLAVDGVDVIAVALDATLATRTTVVDCSTARGAADRALWLCGARELLGADLGVFTVADAPGPLRTLVA